MGTDTQAKFGQTTFIKLSSQSKDLYGQNVTIKTVGIPRINSYGQNTTIKTDGINNKNTYGQTVAISGFQSQVLPSGIVGAGDIIYYGDVANINVESGVLSAVFENRVNMSGMAMPISSYESLSNQNSNSIIYSANDIAVLPALNPGTHLLFSNYNGLNFSISGVIPIVSSIGESQFVSLSGVGSHVALLSLGNKWIATEENGLV